MELLVDDAARRRHPLHVARSNHAPVAAAPIIVIIMILVILVAIVSLSLSLSLSFYHATGISAPVRTARRYNMSQEIWLTERNPHPWAGNGSKDGWIKRGRLQYICMKLW